ncbi:carbonic anhydrase [Brevundimonas variabilis]|uniref:Carbonic anhydrase n=1 Tax=Brevundimonas variabilis TaxID=74312 RepID=A0A7W9FF23_9CAUL|nr:carbonic anhydrase [Brevundimonas variabilis]
MSLDLSRRRLFQCACCLPVAGAAGGAFAGMPFRAIAADPTAPRTTLNPDQALELLREGNRSFNTDSPIRSVTGRARRLELALSQAPFVILVSCSDSRVPPELLFGRGLGEMFIVRNAGNTVDTTALGSIEYAVAQLGVPLIVVMGHQRCGAVSAAVSVVEQNAFFPGAIGAMIEPIVPAVLTAKALDQGDLTENAVRRNIQRTVHRLRTASEPLLLDPLADGRLKIVGAYYSLEDGAVDFFDTETAVSPPPG